MPANHCQITVYGEALVDLVPQSRTSLSPLTPALGGGPFNVARALGRMGARVAFQSRLSADSFGQALRQSLLDAHVDLTGCDTGKEPTTLAVCALDEHGAATYTFYTEGTADRFATPTAVGAGYAVFGTLSLALEPGASRYAEAAVASHAAGAVVCLDPNVRPAFATAEHQQFLRAMLPSVTVLKLSDEEVDYLGDTSAVPVVVTTRGGEGLSVRTANVELDVQAPQVEVADTIGAGDTVMAALVYQFAARGLDRDKLVALGRQDWEEILTFAARAAAITVSRTGANTPTAAELGLLGPLGL